MNRSILPALPAKEPKVRHRQPEIFYPPDSFALFSKLAAIVETINEPRFRNVGEAFHRNLHSVLDTLSVPYRMASASVWMRRFQALHTSERIRSEDERKALEIAHQKMAEEMRTQEGFKWHVNAILSEIDHHLEDPAFRSAVLELLLQGVVLVWGSMEVLLVELYRQTQRGKPSGPKACLQKILNSKDDGETIMREHEIWTVYQQRHLIVHCRGIVDQSYLDQTIAGFQIGSRLLVTSDEVEKSLLNVLNLGTLLLGSYSQPTINTKS